MSRILQIASAVGAPARPWVGIGARTAELLLPVQQHLQPETRHHQRNRRNRHYQHCQHCFHHNIIIIDSGCKDTNLSPSGKINFHQLILRNGNKKKEHWCSALFCSPWRYWGLVFLMVPDGSNLLRIFCFWTLYNSLLSLLGSPRFHFYMYVVGTKRVHGIRQ